MELADGELPAGREKVDYLVRFQDSSWLLSCMQITGYNVSN